MKPLQTVLTRFELRYRSLSADRRPLAFPCDELGRVDIDRLSPKQRLDYLFARAVVGRDFAAPHVQPIG